MSDKEKNFEVDPNIFVNTFNYSTYRYKQLKENPNKRKFQVPQKMIKQIEYLLSFHNKYH